MFWQPVEKTPIGSRREEFEAAAQSSPPAVDYPITMITRLKRD